MGGEQRQFDITVGGISQHLTPHTGEVLILPFEVAKYLVQNRPTKWQPLIIVPNTISTGVDGPTGLDTLDVVVSTVWGITQGGILYWDDTGVDGADVATVTYSSGSGIATFDGGYGLSAAKPTLVRKFRSDVMWWKDSGYERVDFTLYVDREGNATKWLDVPKERLRTLDAISHLSISDHPDLSINWATHQGGTMISITGVKPTRHPDPPKSVVITYWYREE